MFQMLRWLLPLILSILLPGLFLFFHENVSNKILKSGWIGELTSITILLLLSLVAAISYINHLRSKLTRINCTFCGSGKVKIRKIKLEDKQRMIQKGQVLVEIQCLKKNCGETAHLPMWPRELTK